MRGDFYPTGRPSQSRYGTGKANVGGPKGLQRPEQSTVAARIGGFKQARRGAGRGKLPQSALGLRPRGRSPEARTRRSPEARTIWCRSPVHAERETGFACRRIDQDKISPPSASLRRSRISSVPQVKVRGSYESSRAPPRSAASRVRPAFDGQHIDGS